ncbi:MAG: hypothetical protein Tsb0015_02400 [Simkaniaceae bacterium]
MFTDLPPSEAEIPSTYIEVQMQNEEGEQKPVEETVNESRGFHYAFLTSAKDEVFEELPNQEDEEKKPVINERKGRFGRFSKALAAVSEEADDEEKKSSEEAVSERKGRFGRFSKASAAVSEEADDEEKKSSEEAVSERKGRFGRFSKALAAVSEEADDEEKKSSEEAVSERKGRFGRFSKALAAVSEETDDEEKKSSEEAVSERKSSFSYFLAAVSEEAEEEEKPANGTYEAKSFAEGSEEERKPLEFTSGNSRMLTNTDEAVALHPSEDKIRGYAEQITSIFSDGFQWSDLAAMIRLSNQFLKKDYAHLNAEAKKQAVVDILNKIVDLTDTPYLPDGIADPLFKKMVPPFVSLTLPALDDEIFLSLTLETSEETPTKEGLKRVAEQILALYEDGFQWEDFASMVRLAIEHTRSYVLLDKEGRENAVMEIIDDVIEATDTPYLPDEYSDPIFKAFVRPIVQAIFQALK